MLVEDIIYEFKKDLKSNKVEFVNYEFYLNKLDNESRQQFILELDSIMNSQ